MVIEAKNSAGIRRFSYNSRHQQTRVETETGNVQENRYDAEGLRFELLENGRRTSFVYHNGELLQEEGREEQGTSYHLGAGMEAFRRGQELSYYHRDEQLSTAFVTDGQGEIRNSYQYDAFGIPLETTEQLNNRIRYTGQQYDELTEQYYLRARYYNPVAGRFMQEDVYQGDGLNLYAYCGNNPVGMMIRVGMQVRQQVKLVHRRGKLVKVLMRPAMGSQVVIVRNWYHIIPQIMELRVIVVQYPIHYCKAIRTQEFI